MEPKSIVMVAGEPSGDLHGAHLIHALQAKYGSIFVCGMGGRAMRAAGAKIVIDADQVAVVGITEVIAKAPRIIKAMGQHKRLLAALQPDLLILIDFPDFNLHLAAIAKRIGIPVLYYISPQIWAWRAGRVKKIKKRVDHMAVILPFEKQFYEAHQVPVSFVGHPLMDSATGRVPMRAAFDGLPPSPVVGLLPGSRDREVASLLPVMLQAARQLRQKLESVRFIVSCAASIDPASIHAIARSSGVDHLEISHEPVSQIFPKCHLAVVASGTVTLEAAICGTPMIITYVVSPLSYWLGRALIRVDHIGLVNLIAQERIVPELVQKEVTPEAISETAYGILGDAQTYRTVCQNLRLVRERLAAPGASEKVAQIALSLMEKGHAV
ncbi:MAG: lipid-A-disaccharide synthase [Desulfobacterales bacterium]|nr:lipid-A-disaccharide synthase [Desulfobacterales bacterium]